MAFNLKVYIWILAASNATVNGRIGKMMPEKQTQNPAVSKPESLRCGWKFYPQKLWVEL